MERLDLRSRRVFTCGGLALVMALTATATGCRSTRTRPEVPPGRSFGADTGQPPPVNFSSQPNTNALNGLPAAVGTGMPGANQFGTPSPAGGSPYGAPTPNAYGPPGTSGLSGSPTLGSGAAGLPPAGVDPGGVPGIPASPLGGGAAAPAGGLGLPAPASPPTTNPFPGP